MKPEYAEYIKRWCSSVEDVGLVLYIPPVVDGNPITARVPGYESDTINVSGLSPNMVEISPRDLDFGPLLHPRGRPARAPTWPSSAPAWPRPFSPTDMPWIAPS